MALDTLDFNKKILHASWHPSENTIAVRVVQSNICCGCLPGTWLADCGNEQPVLIQRGMIPLSRVDIRFLSSSLLSTYAAIALSAAQTEQTN